MSKYFIADRSLADLLEHELNKEQIIVDKFAKPCTYMSVKFLLIFYDNVWKNL